MSFYSLHQVYDDKKNIAATAFDKSIQSSIDPKFRQLLCGTHAK